MTHASHKPFSTTTLVRIALFTAMLSISAYISIPLPNGTHITILNFILTLISLVFPLSEAFLIGFLWLLLGLCGIPVFVGGQAGPGYLFHLYGGFSFALLSITVLLPLLRGKTYHRLRYTIVSCLAMIFVDAFGSLWIMVLSGCSIQAAFLTGFLPFILLDFVKAFLAAQLVPAFRKILYLNTPTEL